MIPEDFDVYPIHHRGRLYNIYSAFDMTFKEVRALLDCLEGQGAFAAAPDEEFLGSGKLYTCTVLDVTFEVDVHGFELVLYRRNP